MLNIAWVNEASNTIKINQLTMRLKSFLSKY